MLRDHCADLRQSWVYSREELRRVSAVAEKLRRQSRALLKESAVVVAASKQLQTISQHIRRPQLPAQSATAAQLEKPVIATARRVPWRRLQMDDMDGAVEMWVAPDFAETY
jgi:hypothetical protein